MLDPHDAETIRCLRELDRRLAPVIDRILAARGTDWATFRLTLPPVRHTASSVERDSVERVAS